MGSLDALTRSVHGVVVTPDGHAYDEARRVFNAAIDGRPAVIVRCVDDNDVQLAVRFAADEGLSVAVRCGGHSIGGDGMATGAVALDLTRLDGIEIEGGTVTVGGGCTWGRLLDRLEPRGVAVPGGFDDRVGVAGLALGGGYGALTRVHGLTCDNLVGAEIVTAAGARIEADDDLLWALRGAGANFGVATRLRFRLHPVPPFVAGIATYSLDRAREVLGRVRDILDGLPDAATVYVGLSTEAPGLLELHGFHFGALDEARRWLAPLVGVGAPLRADFRAHGYRAFHGANVAAFPDRHHHAWRSAMVRRLDDGVLDVVAEHVARARRERLWIVLEHLGGAMGRVAATATAFPHRDAGFGIVTTVKWQPPERAERALAAQTALHDALRPYAVGRYVNYIGHPPDETDLAAAYGVNLPRLLELKRGWDPDNRFRHNVNLVQT